jgi:hypothetical protein
MEKTQGWGITQELESLPRNREDPNFNEEGF